MILNFQALGAGPSLVCLHGFLGSGDNLWPLADSLKDVRRSLLMDLRGHGRSPHGRPYSLEGMADDVAETLAKEGISSTAVVGHSLGGKVALALALRHPALVERLVLADITMSQYAPYYGFLLDAMAKVPVATLTRRDEAEPYLREAEPLLETRRFLLKNLVPADGGGFKWRFDLEGLTEDHPKILAQVLAGIPYQGKTLLIHGDKSPFVDEAGLALTRQSFPQLGVLTLPGGHWIHVDAKERFNDSVKTFLVGN